MKFYENIKEEEEYDLNLNINAKQTELLEKYEQKLKDFYIKKVEEKQKEWKGQIERAKWKVLVQAEGKLKCKGGCDLTDSVVCNKCESPMYWVDSDERYAICKNCPNNGLSKLSGKLICKGCKKEAYSTVKWIIGHKP